MIYKAIMCTEITIVKNRSTTFHPKSERIARNFSTSRVEKYFFFVVSVLNFSNLKIHKHNKR